jgi:hypothetical protein
MSPRASGPTLSTQTRRTPSAAPPWLPFETALPLMLLATPTVLTGRNRVAPRYHTKSARTFALKCVYE